MPGRARAESQPAELEEAKAASGRIRRRGKDLVKEFIAQVLDGTMTVAKDAEMMINARIAQIDHLVSIQLNEIMHHPALQKLEGTWRGLKYLMDQSETGAMLKIKILNCQQEGVAQGLPARAGIRPELPVQEGLRGRVSASSAARRSRPWWATTNSASTRKTSSCWSRSRMWRRRPTLRSSTATAPDMFNLAGLEDPGRPARPRQESLTPPSTRSGRASGRSEDSRYVGPVPAARARTVALRQRYQAD